MKNKFRELYRLIWLYHKSTLILDCVILIFMGILAPISTWLLQSLIDNMNVGKIAILFFSAYIFVLILREVLSALGTEVISRSKYRFSIKMNNDISSQYEMIPYHIIEDPQTKDILQKVTHNFHESVADAYYKSLQIVSEIVAIIGYAIIISQLHAGAVMGFFLFLGLSSLINYKSLCITSSLFDSETGKERRLNYFSGLLLDKHVISELKIFGSIKYILNKWKIVSDDVLRERLKGTAKSQAGFAVGMIVDIGWMIILIMVAVWCCINHRTSLGTMVAVITAAPSLIALSSSFSTNGVQLSKKLSIVHQYSLFRKIEKISHLENNVMKEDTEAGICFNNVTFSYGEKEVLHNVSFIVEPGESLAIVGDNGAGKSTIVKLIAGLYRPVNGSVTIDGQLSSNMTSEEMKRKLAIVFQDYVHFELSVRENISFVEGGQCNDEKIRSLLKMLSADEFSKCLDQELGRKDENSLDVSEGQWQKFAVARALYQDSKYLILDEPTASLDPSAESEMYKMFSQSLKGKGGIMVSHRLASARFADKILVLSEGRVVEYGTHENLLALNGIYSEMWKKQSGWYREENKNK